MIDFNVLVFDGFETLDVFGPIQVAGRAMRKADANSNNDDQADNLYQIKMFSLDGSPKTSGQGVMVYTQALSEMTRKSKCVLLIPGGIGTRQLVRDDKFIACLTSVAQQIIAADGFVLTVCTGAALLARTGLLDNRKATTNKMAWDWATSQSAEVIWQPRARWVEDGQFFTSSGVSAGCDMTLGFIAKQHGYEVAASTANTLEYLWNSDPSNDPFAIELQ
jgi:putative intracellular protease/amidase